jgi:hypothetical protein
LRSFRVRPAPASDTQQNASLCLDYLQLFGGRESRRPWRRNESWSRSISRISRRQLANRATHDDRVKTLAVDVSQCADRRDRRTQDLLLPAIASAEESAAPPAGAGASGPGHVDSLSGSRTLNRAIQCPILLDFWKAPIQAWAFQRWGHGFKPSALTISFPPLAEIRVKTHSVFKIHHLGMGRQAHPTSVLWMDRRWGARRGRRLAPARGRWNVRAWAARADTGPATRRGAKRTENGSAGSNPPENARV